MSWDLTFYGFGTDLNDTTNKSRARQHRSTSRSQPSTRRSRKNNVSTPDQLSLSPSIKRKLSPTSLSSQHKKYQKDKSNTMSSPHSNPTKDNTMNPTNSPPNKESINTPTEKGKNSRASIEDPQLLALRTELMDAINVMQASIKYLTDQTTESSKLKKINIELNQCVMKLEEENVQLTNRVKVLEDKMCESSIIMQGVAKTTWEATEITKGKVQHQLTYLVSGENYQSKMQQVQDIVIQSVKRLGHYKPMRSRPIAVEFCYKMDADYVIDNRRNLPKGVYVDRMYSEITEADRRILRPILKAARKSTEFRGKCKMVGSDLIIKGKTYTTKNLQNLPEVLSGFRIASQSKDNVYGFFGELNPLSNFYPCKFQIGDQTFLHSEQFIQYQKAMLFKDEASTFSILNTKSARECKTSARNITNFDIKMWEEHAEDLCEPGITAKFVQNTHLGKLLLSTGEKTITECCADKLWRNGVPLYDNICLDDKTWHLQGLLGIILQRVRGQLQASLATSRPQAETQNPIETDEAPT